MRSRTARRSGRVTGQRSRKAFREHRANNGTGRLASTAKTRISAGASAAATDREKRVEARKLRKARPVTGTHASKEEVEG